MRYTALITLVLALAATSATAVAAPGSSTGGSLLVEGGRGTVQVVGRGALVGRVERGSVKITDLSASDQWSPRVNGVPRGKVVWIRGSNISFYVPGGRYKLVARGEGISISARGDGIVNLDGEPDAVGATGQYAVGDQAPQPVPVGSLRIQFGGPEPAPSDGSAKIRP